MENRDYDYLLEMAYPTILILFIKYIKNVKNIFWNNHKFILDLVIEWGPLGQYKV